MPLSTIYHNGVRVIVFNATFINISMGLELWCLMPLSTIYHNEVRVIVFNATFINISQ
jgi:hypothetical protein